MDPNNFRGTLEHISDLVEAATTKTFWGKWPDATEKYRLVLRNTSPLADATTFLIFETQSDLTARKVTAFTVPDAYPEVSPTLTFTKQARSAKVAIEQIKDLISQGRLSEAHEHSIRAQNDFLGHPTITRLHRITAPPSVSRTLLARPSREREYQWLATHRENYIGKWVALDGATLLATADSVRALMKEIEKIPLARTPLVHKID